MKLTSKRLRRVVGTCALLLGLLTAPSTMPGRNIVAVLLWGAGLICIVSTLSFDPIFHWRARHIFGRVVGIWWTVCGLGFLAWGVHDFFHPEGGAATTITGRSWLDELLIAGFAIGVGVLFLALRPPRPDLGDHLIGDGLYRVLYGLPRDWGRPASPSRGRRNWWTGDIKPPTSN